MLRFDEFMHMALHVPEKGYYAQNIPTVGAEGDFSTSATLSPALSKGIADWIQRKVKLLDSKRFHIIECGAGSGMLMKAVREALPWSLRRKCRFHIVETSEPLIAQQRRLLGRRCQWHPSMLSALAAVDGKALIYSNELVDAFPVRVLRRSEGTLQELFVSISATPEEHWQEVSSNEESKLRYLSSGLSDKHNQSYRIEVHESYYSWLQEWLTDWKIGAMLTIDYGDRYPAIYYRMPEGTMRGYYRHNRVTGYDIYTNIGQQDLTADVNFTDLITWGDRAGLESTGLCTQRDFLLPFASNAPVDQFVINEFGAGEAFKVLEQTSADLG